MTVSCTFPGYLVWPESGKSFNVAVPHTSIPHRGQKCMIACLLPIWLCFLTAWAQEFAMGLRVQLAFAFLPTPWSIVGKMNFQSTNLLRPLLFFNLFSGYLLTSEGKIQKRFISIDQNKKNDQFQLKVDTLTSKNDKSLANLINKNKEKNRNYFKYIY